MKADLPPCGGDVRQDRGGRRRTQAIAAILASSTIGVITSLPTHADPIPENFVRLAEIDPTIRQDMRYAGPFNFMGRKADGYAAPACILTRPAAEALARVQKRLAGQGVSLVVFDCYRPARAVADFVRWVGEGGPPDPQWHPKVRRGRLVAEGYIGRRSAHSRGSTVDLGLSAVESPAGKPRDPDCGARDAATLDFGTGFDCFDAASATAAKGIAAEAKANRRLLLDSMRAEGFRNYAREWWHFTLEGEPYPDRRFDFPVTTP